MFWSRKVVLRGKSLLDILYTRMEGLMKDELGERDLVFPQHKFVVEWAGGTDSVRIVFSKPTIFTS